MSRRPVTAPNAAVGLPRDSRAIVDFEDPRESIPGYAVRADGVVLQWVARRRKWVELKRKTGPGGFTKVRLVIRGREREIGVAHLVLRAFVGPRPMGCEPVHYPDSSPGNNRLENLRWAPRGTSKLGRMLAPTLPVVVRGSGHYHAVLIEEDIPGIRFLYRAGLGYKEIAEKLEVSEECIRHVLTGKTWAHIPDPLGPIVMRRKGPSSEECHLSILDWDQVAEIRAQRAAGKTYKEIAAAKGVSVCTVRDIDKERTWRPKNAPAS